MTPRIEARAEAARRRDARRAAEPNAAADVREHLAASRRNGKPFTEAWPLALHTLKQLPPYDRGLLCEALTATMPEWELAYHREAPSVAAVTAPSSLHELWAAA